MGTTRVTQGFNSLTIVELLEYCSLLVGPTITGGAASISGECLEPFPGSRSRIEVEWV